MNNQDMETKMLIPLGYILAIVSLVLIPAGFGLAGIVVGIMNMTKHQIGHGITQIVLSMFCGLLGVVFGIATSH